MASTLVVILIGKNIKYIFLQTKPNLKIGMNLYFYRFYPFLSLIEIHFAERIYVFI